MQVPVVENVLKLNDEVAALNRQALRAAGVFTIDLIGAPGCGKTALLESTLRHLRNELRIGVLVGDLTTDRDGQRLARWTDDVVQINTGRGCHLDANQVRQGLARMALERLDLLVIENVGNLICPVGFDLGQDVKVGMFSVSEGDDKAAKHPYLVYESALLLLNKIDLLPHVPFDRAAFRRDIAGLNPRAQVLELSVANDDLTPWLAWVRAAAARMTPALGSPT
jgi:hydrogenase nickel incorporation protein HypB